MSKTGFSSRRLRKFFWDETEKNRLLTIGQAICRLRIFPLSISARRGFGGEAGAGATPKPTKKEAPIEKGKSRHVLSGLRGEVVAFVARDESSPVRPVLVPCLRGPVAARKRSRRIAGSRMPRLPTARSANGSDEPERYRPGRRNFDMGLLGGRDPASQYRRGARG